MFAYLNLNNERFYMLVENQNEVEVLSSDDIKSCKEIAKAVKGAWSSGLKRDEFINLASDKLVELVSTQPDYELLKSVQGVVINDLINDGLAVDSANTYFSYILKQSIAKHGFVKPSKDTKDGNRMSEKRKAIKAEFEHTSVENITQDLLEVNQRMAQDILAGKNPSKDDKALSSKLKQAQDMKLKKVESELKDKQANNLKALVEKVQKMLKNDTGRFNKNGQPIFEWSIVKLDFVYRCLENQDAIKKFLADKK